MSTHSSVNLPTQQHFTYSYQSAKVYCKFRYNQEIEFKTFRKPLDEELEKLSQLIIEEGVSKRNINNHRVIYEKSLFDNNKSLTCGEKAQDVFDTIMCSFTDNNYSQFTKSFYVKAENVIVEYYKRYFEINQEIKSFRDKQRAKLKTLTERITENGVPKVLLTYTFKRMKADLKAYKDEGNVKEAIDYYDSVYSTIRDDLIAEVLNVHT